MKMTFQPKKRQRTKIPVVSRIFSIFFKFLHMFFYRFIFHNKNVENEFLLYI